MVVSMSEKEFSRLSVLMDAQVGRLRNPTSCAALLEPARSMERRGVSFQLCAPSAISVLHRQRL